MVKSSSRMLSVKKSFSWQTSVLVSGDLSMLLLFVVIGRLSHGMTGDWLVNILRIATPFVVGWFIVAFLFGLYRLQWQGAPAPFLFRSAIGIVIANGIAFLLRRLIFQDGVTIPFALTSVAFTTLFVLAWRLLFLFTRRWLPQAPDSRLSNR